MKKTDLIFEYGHSFTFCAIVALMIFSTSVNFPLTDSFHEGEYVGFMWHMRDYYKGLAVFPLYVHGAIDYIPSLIASIIYGDDCVIVGTRIVNAFIVGANWVIFLQICYYIIPIQHRNVFWITAVITVFYYFVPNAGSDAFTLSSQFLGVRDSFLLLSLLLYSKILTTDKISNALLVLSSLSTVISLFWCYDRGIISAILFIIIFIGLILSKKYVSSFLLMFSAFIFIILIGYLNVFGSIINNANNYIYWIKSSSEISGYPFDMGHLYGYLGAFTLVVFAVATATSAYVLSKGTTNCEDTRNFRLLFTCIIVVQILVIKIIFNRADIHRSFIGAWPSIILMFHFSPKLITYPFDLSLIKLNIDKCKSTLFQNTAFKIAMISFLSFIAITSPNSPKYFEFASSLFHPTHDADLVSPEIRAVSNMMKDIDVGCYFGWTNEGVIALMANKRFCTQYPYVHYVSREKASDMLKQLLNESPSAIVFYSSIWAMTIDGKHMSERFPTINRFIQTNYRKGQRIGNYGIVFN